MVNAIGKKGTHYRESEETGILAIGPIISAEDVKESRRGVQNTHIYKEIHII